MILGIIMQIKFNRNVFNYFYSNMFSPEEGKDNLNEYLYQKGLKIMKRKFKFTRYSYYFSSLESAFLFYLQEI
jgi:hypothetical protein